MKSLICWNFEYLKLLIFFKIKWGSGPRFNPHSIWGFSKYTQIIPNYNFSGMGTSLGIASKSGTGSGIMIPDPNPPPCHLYIIPFYFVVALPICHHLAFHHSAALSRRPHSPYGWLTPPTPSLTSRLTHSAGTRSLPIQLPLLPSLLSPPTASNPSMH